MKPTLATLIDDLLALPAMQAKRDIQQPAALLQSSTEHTLQELYALPGDDCAAIACGDGYQLLAIEGMLPGFVDTAPWFAGWSAVMANVSDITAMGGRATAVVNAYWHHDAEAAREILRGIRDACRAYGLILAGGHTSVSTDTQANLAVAITGYARTLLSTLHVAPGQRIAMAVDLAGSWHGNTAYWKAFEQVSDEQLRAKLAVIPALAERGQLIAAKDISNAGILGTLLMLLEPTGYGAEINLDQLPGPVDTDLLRWLQIFPSYGFLFTLADADLPAVTAAFAEQGITCVGIGQVNTGAELTLTLGHERAACWQLDRHAFTGFRYPKPIPAPLLQRT